MALLDRKALLKKQELTIEKVPLDGEDYVFVRVMTGHEKDTFEQTLQKKVFDKNGKPVDIDNDFSDFRAKLVVNTICDENGKLLLEPGDFPTLSRNMSIQMLEKIVEVSLRLNKITKKDEEELVKNSSAVQDGDSTLNSAEKSE